MATSGVVSFCSFNLHGFDNSKAYLNVLLKTHDVTFVQEHWLTNDNLLKLYNLNYEFVAYGKSAMDEKCSSGILKGRPFGGVAVMWNKKLDNVIS